MTSKCDICFEECPDKIMVKLVNFDNKKYVPCCCCNINICVICAIHMSNSVKKCPICRTDYKTYQFSDLVGFQYDIDDTDAFEAYWEDNDKRVIENVFDEFRMIWIDGDEYAMKRTDKNKSCFDLYRVDDYNRQKKELMIHIYHRKYPVGNFDSVNQILKIFEDEDN
jgi:hypothetical protein